MANRITITGLDDETCAWLDKLANEMHNSRNGLILYLLSSTKSKDAAREAGEFVALLLSRIKDRERAEKEKTEGPHSWRSKGYNANQ